MSDISPSKVQVSLAATTVYNTPKVLNIKGFRADAAGLIEWIDAEGTTHQMTALAGEVPPISGKISITATTAIALTIFL